jgi:membrane protease YdiL (CAAX protease family)
MSEDYRSTEKPLLLRLFLSPDEPRLRAGWRLLLHSMGFGVTLSVLTLLAVLLVYNRGGTFSYGLPIDATIELLAVLITTYAARRLLDRRSFVSLGFRIDQHALPDLVVGFLLPGLLLGAIFLVEWAFGWLTIEGFAWQGMPLSTWLGTLVQGLLLFIMVGVSEEVLSRGYHLQNLTDGINLFWGLLLSSSVFAFLHLLNPESSLFSSLGILAAGYFLAYGWVRTRQLWLSIGLHIGWNLFEGTVFGFPVSGYKVEALIQHNPSGPGLITGGGFGPEAGLIVLPAMLLGALLIRYYTRHRLADRPADEAEP